MALYLSYALGSSIALYVGGRLFSKPKEVLEIDSSNKYILKDNGEELEVVDNTEPCYDLYKCSKCENMLKLSLFSKTQRRKSEYLWKCKVCTQLS